MYFLVWIVSIVWNKKEVKIILFFKLQSGIWWRCYRFTKIAVVARKCSVSASEALSSLASLHAEVFHSALTARVDIIRGGVVMSDFVLASDVSGDLWPETMVLFLPCHNMHFHMYLSWLDLQVPLALLTLALLHSYMWYEITFPLQTVPFRVVCCYSSIARNFLLSVFSLCLR